MKQREPEHIISPLYNAQRHKTPLSTETFGLNHAIITVNDDACDKCIYVNYCMNSQRLAKTFTVSYTKHQQSKRFIGHLKRSSARLKKL